MSYSALHVIDFTKERYIEKYRKWMYDVLGNNYKGFTVN